jgi:hypothetical protein
MGEARRKKMKREAILAAKPHRFVGTVQDMGESFCAFFEPGAKKDDTAPVLGYESSIKKLVRTSL